MDLSNILTVLDKPKHAQSALQRTLALQAQAASDVELVSFCWNPLAGGGSVLEADQRSAMKAKLLKERSDWLRALLAGRPDIDGALVSKAIWSDDIADWVSKRVAKKDIDLVVKSAHPSQSLLHTPLDWELLNNCQVPVLLTSTGRRKKPAKSRSKSIVLAAIDLRHTDAKHRRLNRSVLAAAAKFADLEDARMHCVSAVEVSTVLSDLDVIDERKVKRNLLARSAEELENLLAPYDIPKSRRHFPVGKAGLTVNQIARKLKADLLVVGTNTRRSKTWFGLGNSAQRILSRAVCDVLAVSP